MSDLDGGTRPGCGLEFRPHTWQPQGPSPSALFPEEGDGLPASCVDGSLGGSFWWCIAQPLSPLPPPIGLLGTFAGLAKPTLRHPAPRPHVLRTKGAFLSGRKSARRYWSFSSGILQRGAHIPVAAPSSAEAPRTGTLSFLLLPSFLGGGGGGQGGGGRRWPRLAAFCEISWVFPRALSRCGPWLSADWLQVGLSRLLGPGRQRAPRALTGGVSLGCTGCPHA